MGIFDKKKSIPSRELKSAFRKDRGIIPHTGGKRYFRKEREKMAKEVFGPKYGSVISKNEYRRAIKVLESARKATKTPVEKSKVSREIDYLKRFGGKRI